MSLASAFWNMLAALAVVLLILILTMFVFQKLLKQKMPIKDDGAIINIISVRYLGPKNSLLLVDVLGKPILISISNQQVSYLTTLDDEVSIQKLKAINNTQKSHPLDRGLLSRCRDFVLFKAPGKDS